MGLFDFLKKNKEDELGDLGGDFGEPGAGLGMPGPGGVPPPRPGAVGGVPGSPALFGGAEQQPVPPPPAQPISPTPINLGPQPVQIQRTPGMDIASKIEVLNSKIDSLRIAIERVNDRLEFLERFLKGR